MGSKILISLPAYNEGKVIKDVILKIKKEGFKDILVVDDCSNDDTFLKAKLAGAKVLKHLINRGAGAATYTALIYAKRNDYDYIVFLDSDGQHNPNEIKKLLSESKKFDVIIGSRMMKNLKDMPFQRRIANFIGSFLTFFFFKKYIKDSQSGFKIFNKKAINRINISFDRYEFCSEIVGEINLKKLTFKEVPIQIIYSKYSLENKGSGQSIFNGFKMIIKFFFK